MVCPDCHRFPSKNTEADPEVDVRMDENGDISGTVRIVNSCDNCGTELEEFTFEVSEDVKDVMDEHVKEHKAKGLTHHFDFDVDSCERTDEMKRTDRHGKPIKNSRYMKRMYGYELTGTVSCDCKKEWSHTINVSDATNAGSMESLV